MRIFQDVLAIALGAQSVAGTFLPVKTLNNVASLQTREESMRRCMEPVLSVELHYMEGKAGLG